MIEWLAQVPYAVAFLLILILPGWLALYTVGFRGALPVTAAPPVSLGIVAATGIVAAIFRIPWSTGTYFGGMVLVLAGALIMRRLILGKLPPPPPKKVVKRPRYASPIALSAATIIAIITSLPVMIAIDPALPQQQIDSVFHYNVAWTITQTGDASLFTAASTNYGIRAIPTYYPVVWHALVAMVGGAEAVVPATNTLVVMCFAVWSLGIAGLTLEAFPRSRWAPVIAVTATMLFPVFPTYMAIYRQLWPNLLGYCVIPAAVSLVLRALRLLQSRTETGLRRSLTAGLSALWAILGAIATYPSALFGVALLIAPLASNLVIEILKWIRRRFGRKNFVLALLGLTSAVVVSPIAVFVWRPSTLAFFTRPSYAEFDNLASKTKALVSLWPLQNGMPFILIAVAIIVLITIAGLVQVLRRKPQRWIAWAWALPMLFTLACYIPLGPMTSLTGLWYNDPNRLLPLALPSVCLFAAAIVSVIEKRIADLGNGESRLVSKANWVAVLTALIAATVAAISTWPARKALVVQPYNSGSIQLVKFANTKELEFIESLRGKLNSRLMVLGEPTTGAAYLQALSGQKVALPHVTYRSIDTDSAVLAKHFKEIQTDPRICHIVLHYGIGYYYADKPGKVSEFSPSERSPGLFNVDTTRGFELVGESESSRLFKITACGPVIPSRGFFGLSNAWEPLYDNLGERNSFWRNGVPALPGENAKLWKDGP